MRIPRWLIAVKYTARPCQGQTFAEVEPSYNFLRRAMVKHLAGSDASIPIGEGEEMFFKPSRVARYALLLLLLPLISAPASPIDPVDPAELTRAVTTQRAKVHELAAIRELAKKHGVRVWLMGGSAASFVHYVKWDILRQRGDTEFAPEKFDYDLLFNILHPAQDLDLALEGSDSKVVAFTRALRELFPYELKDKSRWEVRTLTQSDDARIAPLATDFIRQHSDSLSNLMVELSDSAEPVIRTPKEWEARPAIPDDLKLLAQGKIRYRFSKEHEQTKRFKDRKNPPALSVFRFLTKAFQFGYDIEAEDLKTIKEIIASSSPRDWPDYVDYWLNQYGPKIIRYAWDAPRAKTMIDQLGLRNLKDGIIERTDAASYLGWWLNKEPLRDESDPAHLKPRGSPTGRTAKDLGITRVTHDTKTFEDYLSIVWSPRPIANLFISREETYGESAAYGDGLYTCKGDNGAYHGVFPVRLDVDPSARENVDFVYDSDERIVWLTRDKLRLVRPKVGIDEEAVAHLLYYSPNDGDKVYRIYLQRHLHQFESFSEESRRFFQGYLSALSHSGDLPRYVKNGDAQWKEIRCRLLTKFPRWADLVAPLFASLDSPAALEFGKCLASVPGLTAKRAEWEALLNRLPSKHRAPLDAWALASSDYSTVSWAKSFEGLIAGGEVDEILQSMIDERLGLSIHYRSGLWRHALKLSHSARAKFFAAHPLPEGLSRETIDHCAEQLAGAGSKR